MDKKNCLNPEVVEAFVTLLNALSESNRRAVFERFREKTQKPPSLIGLGRAGSSLLTRSELVDYCKRIEFCYKRFGSRDGKQPPFIPFDKTEQLALAIAEKEGEPTLKAYVEYLEQAYSSGESIGFSRPERMKEHFLTWKEKGNPSPPQPN